jgi:hypothetical protein
MNTTTQHLDQMTTAELNRAILAVGVLTSELIEPYICDPILSAKLSSLKIDLDHEATQRP